MPIPAVAVRELIYDANGQIVKEPPRDKRRAPAETPAVVAELKPGQTRKETEGVFVLRNGRAEFVPITVGIAGDRYFEVLSGLKDGDQVITGPYNSVRGMADGDQVKVQEPEARQVQAGTAGQQEPPERRDSEAPLRHMNKFLDSAMIALEAIWAAKLRSFMTVLGNIVAVTSIIAVVSLIQGLNASVKEAIVSQAGADSFNIQQYPRHQERRGIREGPVEPADLAAGRARDSPLRQPADRRRHGGRQRPGPRHVSRPIDRQHTDPGS